METSCADYAKSLFCKSRCITKLMAKITDFAIFLTIYLLLLIFYAIFASENVEPVPWNSHYFY